jgi:allantoin racemase
MDSVIPSLERMVRAAGMTKVLASVRAVNIPVLALTKNRDTTLTRIEAESLAAVEEDKADVIVLGCMSMAFMEITGYLRTSLGIPVVNPALVSLAVLEGLVHAGLAHSKKTYPF